MNPESFWHLESCGHVKYFIYWELMLILGVISGESNQVEPFQSRTTPNRGDLLVTGKEISVQVRPPKTG